MSIVQFGTIPLVAVASFFLGKLWQHSETILLGRQRAYAEFLRKCTFSGELQVIAETPEIEKIAVQLREASAEISLYGSRRVEKAMTAYLQKLGFLVGAHGMPSSELRDETAMASRLYEEMTRAMRQDALGWSIFAVGEWVGGWKKKTR